MIFIGISLSLIAELTICDVNVSLDWFSKGVALFKNLLGGPMQSNSISRVKNIWGSLRGCWLGDKAMIEWGNNRDGRSLSGAPPPFHPLKEIFLSSSLGIRGAHSLSPGQEISDKAKLKRRRRKNVSGEWKQFLVARELVCGKSSCLTGDTIIHFYG